MPIIKVFTTDFFLKDNFAPIASQFINLKLNVLMPG